MKATRSLLWILFTASLSVLAGIIAARMLAQKTVTLQGGTWLPQSRALAQFQLSDFNGHPFANAALRGHPTLVFFGYTSCPDVCPTTLATLRDLQHQTPLSGLQILFITVDPDRDTPAVLRQYLGSFDAGFIGLRASHDAVAPLMQSLGAGAFRQDLPGDSYTLDHSATLYLLDTRGRLAAVFTPPYTPATLAADLHAVARASVL